MTRIQFRRDTSTRFNTVNPILASGEPAFETDTKKWKIGDGNTPYVDLAYKDGSGGGSGEGTSDYTQLVNKPRINGVELEGDKSTTDLNIDIPDVSNLATKDELQEGLDKKEDKLTALQPIKISDSKIVTIEDGVTTLNNKIISTNRGEKLYGKFFYNTEDNTKTVTIDLSSFGINALNDYWRIGRTSSNMAEFNPYYNSAFVLEGKGQTNIDFIKITDSKDRQIARLWWGSGAFRRGDTASFLNAPRALRDDDLFYDFFMVQIVHEAGSQDINIALSPTTYGSSISEGYTLEANNLNKIILYLKGVQNDELREVDGTSIIGITNGNIDQFGTDNYGELRIFTSPEDNIGQPIFAQPSDHSILLQYDNTLTVNEQGQLSVVPSQSEIPTATKEVKGGVIVGDNIDVDDTGKISVTLPDTSKFVTNDSLATTLDDYATNSEVQSQIEAAQQEVDTKIETAKDDLTTEINKKVEYSDLDNYAGLHLANTFDGTNTFSEGILVTGTGDRSIETRGGIEAAGEINTKGRIIASNSIISSDSLQGQSLTILGASTLQGNLTVGQSSKGANLNLFSDNPLMRTSGTNIYYPVETSTKGNKLEVMSVDTYATKTNDANTLYFLNPVANFSNTINMLTVNIPVNNCIVTLPSEITHDDTTYTIPKGTQVAIPNGRDKNGRAVSKLVTLTSDQTTNVSTFNGEASVFIKGDGTVDQTAWSVFVVYDIDAEESLTDYCHYYDLKTNKYYLIAEGGVKTERPEVLIGHYNLAEAAAKKYFLFDRPYEIGNTPRLILYKNQFQI